jgi:ATP/maltotriose-dependent transcriptional regulator MalT
VKEQPSPHHYPRRIIERPRLLKQLEETSARTILLVAPAGYGKTILLRQWAQRNAPPFWLTADIGSSDLAQLATRIAEMLEAMSPGLRDDIAQVVGGLSNPSRSWRQLVDAIVTRVSAVSSGTLVIDDYHLLAGNPLAEDFIHELSERLRVHLLIGSRLRPSWATTRSAIYGDLLELGPEELALTPEETTDVLAGTPEFAEGVLAQANGWPAVIGLAALTKRSRRTPDGGLSTTLFRFFAEELFSAAPGTLREELLDLALLPVLSQELLEAQLSEQAAGVLAEVIAHGFATAGEHEHELHPLIREYLLSKLSVQEDAEQRVNRGVNLCLHLQHWDGAFELIQRFGRADLLDQFVESAFMPLARMGRISTLERVRDFARARSMDFVATITLVDAELAFRDGLPQRAEALAARAAHALGGNHTLQAHAYWVAGQGAQLRANYMGAAEHFERARATATDDDDVRDALWGLMLTSIFSEALSSDEIAVEFEDRRNLSPTDLVLATTAAMLLRRYAEGFEHGLDVEDALHSLASVPNPRIRTVFTNILSWVSLVQTDYMHASQMAELTREQATKYQLSWAVPHAEWGLAAAALGCRDLGAADRWLRRVERTVASLSEPVFGLNVATLRSRFFLTLRRPEQAYELLNEDDSGPIQAAMRAEFVATRALVFAVLGEREEAEAESKRASSMSVAVDVSALLACVNAISEPSENSVATAFATAQQFGVWDPLVSAIRAHPPLLSHLAESATRRRRLEPLLRRSNDFDLARQAGLHLGTRPRKRGSPLSPREREVLELIRQGLTNRQIGELLFISPGTAKVHVRNILEKLGARSRTEAATRSSFDI